MLVLGIETTCDETAAAVVELRQDGSGRIASSIVRSQIEEHAPFGGVVPEIAARAHVNVLDRLIAQAMKEAGVNFASLQGVAAAAGPGLVGGVIVGLTTAKAIALVHDLPLIAVNHLEAHALTARLTDNVPFPYLLLLVSGGHTQLLWVSDVGQYRRLGTTLDDALGEAFDKVAKLLGLGFPGGPKVSEQAKTGDATRFTFPRPMLGRDDLNFSFSGLKTAVRQAVMANTPLDVKTVTDVAASFEAAVAESVEDRVARAIAMLRDDEGRKNFSLVVAGGVAANEKLRDGLKTLSGQLGVPFIVPPPALCTDNAAMIAWAGAERLARGMVDRLGAPPRARWALDETAAPLLGSGRLGAKA